jgi:uncharacterized iron-regulated membrane protein
MQLGLVASFLGCLDCLRGLGKAIHAFSWLPERRVGFGSPYELNRPSTPRRKNERHFETVHAASGLPVMVHLNGLARVRLK